MKSALFCLLLIIFSAAATANDTSCLSDLMKPKLNPALSLSDTAEPAELTVTDTQARLKDKHQGSEAEKQTPSAISVAEDENNSKKESRLGGIFDILLPAKLRNPVK